MKGITMKTLLILFTLIVFGGMVSWSQTESKTKKQSISTNSVTDEERLLAAIPELKWNQERFVKEGWMKEGQKIMPKANSFSKKETFRFGVYGDIDFLFDNKKLIFFSFYIHDGEVGTTINDNDWSKLYGFWKNISTSKEDRSGDAKKSYVSWIIKGSTNDYDVKLYRRVSGNSVERSLEINFKDNTQKKTD